MRSSLIRVGQVAATFVLFSIFNAISVKFEIDPGVSILFPATAISILGCIYFGNWGAIGVVLATIATPSPPDLGIGRLLVAGAINASEGFIPFLLFRTRRNLSRDLRDVRSLIAFLLFGTIVNTGFSAIAGNIRVGAHPAGVMLNSYQASVCGTADFAAPLLLATPVRASPGIREPEQAPRALV